MDKPFGNVYTVVRPGDNAVVPLTCTEEQLPDWLEEGYTIVESATEVINDGTDGIN